MKRASEIAEYGSLTTRAQSRGSLRQAEERDISDGLWTARERSEEEIVSSQRMGGRHLVELALTSDVPNERAWEILQTLADERVVDFMHCFEAKNRESFGIGDPNFNGMKYTLTRDFVDYLDGQRRTDATLERSQEAREEGEQQWLSFLREEYGDTLTTALDRLWREDAGLAVCVYRHCFLKEPLDMVAPIAGLKTKGGVSKRVSRGLDLMRGWVLEALAPQDDAA